LVPLAAGAGDRDEVVVADEDAQVGVLGEPLRDPAVVLAADLALVDVRLGRVDGDQSYVETVELEAEAVVPGPERLLVQEVADVARVVVAGNEDDVFALDTRELVPRVGVLLG